MITDVSEPIIELNRRLIHRAPRADIIETLKSAWFKSKTSWPSSGCLRMYGRVCRIAQQNAAKSPTEKNNAALAYSFNTLGKTAAALYLNTFNGKDRAHVIRYLKIFFKESRSNGDIESEKTAGLFLHAVDKSRQDGTITYSIWQSLNEPWRATGWAINWGPRMSHMLSLAEVAPEAARTLLVEATLIIAEVGLAKLQEYRRRRLPQSYHEALFENKHADFKGMTLNNFVASDVGEAMKRVVDLSAISKIPDDYVAFAKAFMEEAYELQTSEAAIPNPFHIRLRSKGATP